MFAEYKASILRSIPNGAGLMVEWCWSFILWDLGSFTTVGNILEVGCLSRALFYCTGHVSDKEDARDVDLLGLKYFVNPTIRTVRTAWECEV